MYRVHHVGRLSRAVLETSRVLGYRLRHGRSCLALFGLLAFATAPGCLDRDSAAATTAPAAPVKLSPEASKRKSIRSSITHSTPD